MHMLVGISGVGAFKPRNTPISSAGPFHSLLILSTLAPSLGRWEFNAPVVIS